MASWIPTNETTRGIERLPGTGRIATVVTPSGPLSLMRVVAERLLAEGVISGDLNGTLHANDAATVKAAMMTHGICDFCSAPGVVEVFNIPDFEMPHGGRSVDGWGTCAVCAELVQGDRRKDLLSRAVNSLAFSKFTKGAIQDLHNKFWYGFDGMRIANTLGLRMSEFVDDTLPDPPPELKFSGRETRVRALSDITHLTVEELERVMDGTTPMPPALAVKVMAWAKTYGKDAKTVDAAMINALVGGPRKPVHADNVPHWQRALDAQVAVRLTLGSLLHNPDAQQEWFPDTVDLSDPQAVKKIARTAEARQTFRNLGFDQDYRLIQTATVYSFNAETEAAISQAAESIPHDAPLSSIETPTGSGWFWFGEPLKVASSPAASERTHALLWAWVNATGGPNDDKEPVPSLMFSAYVLDESGQMGSLSGKLLPSTRWYWPLTMSFHDMLKFNASSWLQSYGPGTAMDGDPNIISQQATVNIISELSLFFTQACLWFRQTVPGNPKKKLDPILTQAAGHIERHARKRAQKDLKLDAPPVVHVVALRRTAKTEVEPSEKPSEPGTRDYHYRWIVKGHSRLQACGPGRKDRKLIWIDAYPAGPPDKPLKTKTTVYAVVR